MLQTFYDTKGIEGFYLASAAAGNALLATQLPAFTKLVQGGIFIAPTVGAATLAGTTKAVRFSFTYSRCSSCCRW